jgi:hypothetical protein
MKLTFTEAKVLERILFDEQKRLNKIIEGYTETTMTSTEFSISRIKYEQAIVYNLRQRLQDSPL